MNNINTQYAFFEINFTDLLIIAKYSYLINILRRSIFMLKNSCINPEIISTLSFCGHGDKILIVDGNYPLASKSGNAKKVYLGVSKGLPTITDVLKALTGSVNFEAAEVMMPEDGSTTEIMEEVKTLLPKVKISSCSRLKFYENACDDSIRLAISTGEQRFYGCIILTVFVA